LVDKKREAAGFNAGGFFCFVGFVSLVFSRFSKRAALAEGMKMGRWRAWRGGECDGAVTSRWRQRKARLKTAKNGESRMEIMSRALRELGLSFS